MQSHSILAVHGFLGSAHDWTSIQSHLDHLQPGKFQWIKPDLFHPSSEILRTDLQSFERLTQRLIQFLPNPSISGQEKPIFIGYSLGARIGLHLLKHYSDHFKSFVFISAHPGLYSVDEKISRQKSDLLWNEKLQKEQWSDFIHQWASQPVFATDQSVQRPESHFDRDKLTYALTSLSLSQQENFESLILQNQSKMTWVVGEQDSKFLNVAINLQQKKILSNFERIQHAGHRVIFDQPQVLAQILAQVAD